MSKRVFTEVGSSEVQTTSKQPKSEPSAKKLKANEASGKSGGKCEYCNQRSKTIGSKSEEPIEVDDSVLVDERQLQRTRLYTEGLADAVDLYKVPSVLVALVTGYLYPNCATDDELRECETDEVAFDKLFSGCVLKDHKEKLGDYYTLALKLKTTMDVWNHAVSRMDKCLKLHRILDSGSLELSRTLLCDLPQPDLVRLLLVDDSLLVNLALEMTWEMEEKYGHSSKEPLDTRRFALLKRLVNDTNDWHRILMNQEGDRAPAIMQVMATDLSRYEELIPALLPNDSFRHNEDFWDNIEGEFEDCDDTYTLMDLTDAAMGIQLRQVKAIVCPQVYYYLTGW